MKHPTFYLSLLAAAVALVAWLWPVDREGELIPILGTYGYYGFINADGRVVYEPQWDKVKQFDSMGTAQVSNDGGIKWQVLDKLAGVQPNFWDEIGEFDEKGMAFARDGGLIRCISRDGSVVMDNVLSVSTNIDPYEFGLDSAIRVLRFDRNGIM